MASNYNQRSNSSGSNANRSSSSGKKPSVPKRSSSLDRSRAGYYATTHHTTGTDSYAKNTTQKKPNPATPTRSRGAASSPSRSSNASSHVSTGSGGTRASSYDSRSSSSQPQVSRSSRSTSAYSSTASRSPRSSSVNPSAASRPSRPTSGYRSSAENRPASATRYSSNPPRANSSARRGPANYGSSSRSSGVSVREIRANQRSQEQARLRRILINRIVVIAVVLLVVFGGALGIYLSPLFSVETVTVSGASYLTEQEILDLADVPDTATLLRFDKKDVLARLEENPWIEEATIKRKLFNGLEISIAERTLIAVVQVPIDATSGIASKWAISTDGVWLARIDETAYAAAVTAASSTATEAGTATGGTGQVASLTQRVAADAVGKPIISDAILETAPEAGTLCSDQEITNALTILSTLSHDLLDQVVSVSAASASSTSLTLENKVVVAFGSSDDILTKERIILQLLEEHAGQISYINVRVVDRPAWRGVE